MLVSQIGEPVLATFDEQRTEGEKAIDEELLLKIMQGIRTLEREHGPGWVDQINLDTLQLASIDRCVLGQVYGEYTKGCRALGQEGQHAAAELGFTLPLGDDGVPPYGWQELNNAWREQIQALKALR